MKTYRESVQNKEISISAELSFPQDSTATDVYRQADALQGIVDGVLVSDNHWPIAQMSTIAAASLVQERGIDPIASLSCHDRNRIALQSELIGLRALGVTSAVLQRGQLGPNEQQLASTAVLDTNGRELVEIANALNEEPGTQASEQFFIGTTARAFRPDSAWDTDALDAKAKAGAQFLQLHLSFKPDLIRSYVDALVKAKLTWKYSIIVSLAVLESTKSALWLKQNIPDSGVPSHWVDRLESASDPGNEGVSLCADLIRQVAEIPGVSGLNLVSMGSPDAVPAAIRASGLRS